MAIGDNAQFHKDPKCARIALESHIDDFLGAGVCSEVEPLREQARVVFKLKVLDLIPDGVPNESVLVSISVPALLHCHTIARIDQINK